MDKVKRKRERLEMIFDILTIIRNHQNSIKPTPLLRQSNLSSQSFTEYLNELLEKDLVKEITDENERKFLTLTDKGFKYLEKYKLILGFIEEFEL
ncbi:MAG: winged helix-turn-helix transcriptional regulator [Candidatus Methanoperedens sp.]|nr:winged helix-turn-helix transcriptional regulator [Candidatus Methanoperedens sp.]